MITKNKLAFENESGRFRTISIILFGTIILLLTCFYLFADIRKVLIATPDDAAYYYKIIENLINGKGFSFDGIHQTNGFQPLWAYILIPFDFIFHSNQELKFRFYQLLQTLFLLAAGLINYSVLKKFFNNKSAFVSLLVFFLLVFMQAINGMESALLIFLFTILFCFSIQINIIEEESAVKNFIFGIILGLITLTRLDMLFLIISLTAFGIFYFFVSAKKKKLIIKKYLFILLGFLIIVSPYLISNVITTGKFVPISGILKSTFPHITLNTEFDFTISQKFIISISVLTSLFYLAWFAVKIKSRFNPKDKIILFRSCLSVISMAVIMQFVFSIFFMGWGVSGWQFIYFGMFLAFAAGEQSVFILNRLSDRKIFTILYFSLCVVFLILLAKTFSRFNLDVNKSWHAAAYDAALWARANSKQSDVYAMKDTGIFGFFSTRKVINLDGLVNDLQYQEYLKSKQLNRYLRENKVKYFVQPAFPAGSNITKNIYENYKADFFSYKYSVQSDPLILLKKNEVYRSRLYEDKAIETVFIIWKLN